MKENKDFFGRVKAWCKEHKTTIKALMQDASGGEWTEDVYQGWRRTNSAPDGENIARLAAYMGVSCDYLITGEEENGLTESEMEAVKMAQRLSSGNFQRWLDFGSGLAAGQDKDDVAIAFEKRRSQAGA